MCKTPTIVPFCKAFEPNAEFGIPVISLGFSTIRTCSPKSVKAPEYYMLGQRTTSNNEHGRGITHKPYTIVYDT